MGLVPIDSESVQAPAIFKTTFGILPYFLYFVGNMGVKKKVLHCCRNLTMGLKKSG